MKDYQELLEVHNVGDGDELRWQILWRHLMVLVYASGNEAAINQLGLHDYHMKIIEKHNNEIHFETGLR